MPGNENIHKESYYQGRIIKFLKETYPGAFIWKVTAGPYSQGGIPDICMVLDGHAFFFEVKRHIIDYLPINSVERQICELRHIDFKPWGMISAEIPMSRSQTYRRYRMALDALLSNQRIRNIVEEHEGEYDECMHGHFRALQKDATQ